MTTSEHIRLGANADVVAYCRLPVAAARAIDNADPDDIEVLLSLANAEPKWYSAGLHGYRPQSHPHLCFRVSPEAAAKLAPERVPVYIDAAGFYGVRFSHNPSRRASLVRIHCHSRFRGVVCVSADGAEFTLPSWRSPVDGRPVAVLMTPEAI